MVRLRPALVASDIDGTLLHSAGTLSRRTQDAIAGLDRAGIPLVLVTARPMRWMADFRGLAGLHGLAVVSNGAVVMDLGTGEPLEVTGIAPADGLALVEAVRAAVPGARVAVETPAGLVRDAAYVESHPIPSGSPVGPLAEVWVDPGVKLLVQHPDGAEVVDGDAFRSAVAEALGERATPTWTIPGLVEVGPPGVTKATTLARVAAELGVGPEDVMAFGDMPNDIPMLTWAGRGLAVANAHADVLAVADGVVPANDEDGVARTLEGLLG